jgi:hypothetical protein
MITADFPFLNRLPFGLLIIPLMFMQVKLNQNLVMTDLARVKTLTNEGRRLDPELLKSISFGNLPMAIDYLTLLILGDSDMDKVPKGTHTTSYFYLDAIVALDPMFSEINPLANMLAVLRGDAFGARDLLEKSQDFVRSQLPAYSQKFKDKYWPHPWQGQLFLAYVNIFELDDLPRAAIAFREAAAMPGGPPYLQRLEKKLNRPGGEYDVGLKLLEFMISGARDQRYRESLENKSVNLKVGQFLYKINEAFQRFAASSQVTRSTPPKPLALGLAENQKLVKLWENFLKTTHTSSIDPWGGQLYIKENKIASTTPHEKVFGLE